MVDDFLPNALAQLGPLVHARLSGPDAGSSAVDGMFLVDTGSTHSAVVASVADRLALPNGEMVGVGSAGDNQRVSLYRARLAVETTSAFLRPARMVDLGHCKLVALVDIDAPYRNRLALPLLGFLGRDLLARAVFTYDGRGRYSLRFR